VNGLWTKAHPRKLTRRNLAINYLASDMGPAETQLLPPRMQAETEQYLSALSQEHCTLQ